METKYSKTEFEGYTHRFIVRFSVSNDWRDDTSLNIYSNSDSRQGLEDYIDKNKSEKVVAFRIEHRASKEQDEMADKLIEETLKDI